MLTLRTRNLPRTFLRLALIITTPIVLFVAAGQYFTPTNQPSNNAPLPRSTVSSEQVRTTTSGLPVRLMIPGINIDSPIEHIGTTPEGAMDITENPDGVVWFKLGPRPGDGGNAVMAGHYGWDNGKPAVFNNLHTLRPGDKLYIQDDRKMIIPFVVRESRKYNPEADAPEVFTSQDGKPHLNLITCNGTWSEAKQTYSHRLVIFTDKAV